MQSAKAASAVNGGAVLLGDRTRLATKSAAYRCYRDAVLNVEGRRDADRWGSSDTRQRLTEALTLAEAARLRSAPHGEVFACGVRGRSPSRLVTSYGEGLVIGVDEAACS